MLELPRTFSRIGAAPLFLLLAACGWNPLASKEDYLARGNARFEEGKFGDAVIEYQKAVQKDPNFAEAYYRMGLAFERDNKPTEAFAAYRQTTEIAPDHLEALTRAADLALTRYLADPRRPRALYELIEQAAEKLLERDPNSFDGNRFRGHLALSDGKPEAALEAFRKALAAQPNEPRTTTAVFECLRQLGRNAEAEQTALSLIEAQPTFAPIYDLLYARYRDTKRDELAGGILERKIRNNPGNGFFVIQLAEHKLSLGRTAEAEALVEELTAKADATADTLRDAGDHYARRGQFDKALALYRRGVAAHPARANEFRNRMVEVQLATGRIEEASKTLDEVLAADPKAGYARSARASLRMARGTPQEVSTAIAEFEALVKDEPENLDYRMNLARALRAAGRNEEAQQQLLEVVRRNGNHVGALRELAQIRIANQEADLALQYAEQVLALAPQDPSARLVRTAAWALQGQYARIRPELERLAREFPNLPEVAFQRGLLELAEKRLEQAEKIFRAQYRPGSPDVRPLKGLVEVAFARNNPAQALALVEQEIRVHGETRERLELLAQTAARAGRLDAARLAWERMAATDPNNPSVLTALGLVAAAQGDRAAALKHLEKASAAAPGAAGPLAALAGVHYEAGERRKAIELYRKALALDAENAGIQNNLAYALAEEGADLQQALELARRAAQRYPNQPEFADTLGFVYLKRGETQAAIQVFRSAIARRPDLARLRINLAAAYLEVGDQTAARTELERAMAIASSPDERERVRQLLAKLP